MVHTSGRGSVQAVLAVGWLAQADSRIMTAMAQTLRIVFSKFGANKSASESLTLQCARRTQNLPSPP
jgi:hypothetical protein